LVGLSLRAAGLGIKFPERLGIRQWNVHCKCRCPDCSEDTYLMKYFCLNSRSLVLNGMPG
jgi:hypothetical protein